MHKIYDSRDREVLYTVQVSAIAINEQRIALLPEDVRRAITMPDAP